MYVVTTTSAAATSSIVRPDLASVSVTASTRSPGAKRSASETQFDTTLVGATTRNGAIPGLRVRA